MNAIGLNIKLLVKKKLTVLFFVLPFPLILIQLATSGYAVFRFVFFSENRKRIIKFAQEFFPGSSPHRFVWKYYQFRSQDHLFTHLFCEKPNRMRRFLSIENLSQLRMAMEKGNGAILLGAHYGPMLARIVLGMEKLKVRSMISFPNIEEFNFQYKKSLSFLKSRYVQNVHDAESFISGRSERSSVRYLQKGGLVLMLTDYFKKTDEDESHPRFLGHPVWIEPFPFLLSLRYRIPLFFVIIVRSGVFRYRLLIKLIEEFQDSFEGESRYFSELEKVVLEKPLNWGVIGNSANPLI